MKLSIVIRLTFFLLVCGPLWAAEHHPYTRYSFTYRALFVDSDKNLFIFGQQVQPGDRIVLETGESVIYHRSLGSGGNTVVFEDSTGRAVRLNKDPSDWVTNAGFLRYEDAIKDLNQLMNPRFVVKLQGEQPISENVYYVENLPIEVLMEDYLNDPNLDRQSEMYLSLLVFFKEISRFQFIGDFAPFQIGWVPERGWVLLDFDLPIRLNPSGTTTSPYKVFYEWDILEDWSVYVNDPVLKTVIRDYDQLLNTKTLRCRIHFL